jgi:drug/metabolite transporter (DMT)-like permease
MSGVVWAAIAGVLFGVFQSVNRVTLVAMDVYASTFVQLVVCSLFMMGALAVQGAGLRGLTASAAGNFAVAGLIHFVAGWTLLNASQKRVGAARTSPLIATTPLFAVVVAWLTLDEVPDAIELVGMAMIVAGVYVTRIGELRPARVQAVTGAPRAAASGATHSAGSDATHGAADRAPITRSIPGLGAAFAWAVSPIFIRNGLAEVDRPVLGVTVGVLAATVAYALVLVGRRRGGVLGTASRGALVGKVLAGVLVGLATWTRWYSLSLTTVAAVLSLALLSVPTVIVLAPVLAGRRLERITVPVVAGAGLVVVGALVLIVGG